MNKGKLVREIDGNKLENYLKKEGIRKSELSREMGCSRNMINNAIRTNTITETYYKLMCLLLKVEEDFFELQSEISDENIEVEAYEQTNLDTDLLNHILNELVILNNNIANFIERTK